MKVHRIPRGNGRFLSFMETGHSNAPVWFYCHGIPGSKKEVLMATANNRTGSVRLIAIDRPGCGDSTQWKSYSFSDHADDMRAVAEYLQIKVFSLLGFSGGGVFAMATAQAFKGRIQRVVLVGTPCVPILDSPFNHAGRLTAQGWHAALTAPEDLIAQLATLTVNSNLLTDALMDSLSDMEQQSLQISRVYTAFQENLAAATQQGDMIAAESIVRDTQLMVKDWPFNLENMAIPVEIFHGEQDNLVHLEHGQALASSIPGSTLTTLSKSGHYDTLIKACGLRMECWGSRPL